MTEADQPGTQPSHKIRKAVSVFKRYPVIPVFIVLTLIFTAIFANILAPYSPYEQSLPDRLKPPFWVEGGSTRHLLGTDLLGRDVFSRLLYGSRISLLVAFMGILVAGSIGAVLGILSGLTHIAGDQVAALHCMNMSFRQQANRMIDLSE